MDRLAQLLPPGLLVVADSALGHLKNLCEADRAGLRFVVPLRADTGFGQRFLAEVGPDGLHPIRYLCRREAHPPAHRRTRYRGALRDYHVTDPKTGQPRSFRVAYIWSSEEATSVAQARDRALAKAETALTKVSNGLGGRYYTTRKQVDAKVARILANPRLQPLLAVTTGTSRGKPTLTWQRDHDAITAAARLDGIYALATNLPGRLSATGILRTYKDQHLVEQAHRANKGTLKVRPIFLHNDDRIAALISIVGLALLLYGLIETDLRHALGDDQQLPGLLPEGRAARPTGRNILAAFQGLGATHTPTGSSWTDSPPPNAPSSTCSTSTHPGPPRTRSSPTQVRKMRLVLVLVVICVVITALLTKMPAGQLAFDGAAEVRLPRGPFGRWGGPLR